MSEGMKETAIHLSWVDVGIAEGGSITVLH